MGHSSKRNPKTELHQPQPALPFSFDPNSLNSMLGNIDVSAMANMLNNIDLNQVMSFLNGSTQPVQEDTNGSETKTESPDEAPQGEPIQTEQIPNPLNLGLPPTDPIYIVLNSMKPFLPEDKCKIIDDMVKLIGIKSVIDTVFPPANPNK